MSIIRPIHWRRRRERQVIAGRTQAHSIHYLYLEIIGPSILMAVLAFNGVFAVQLGASTMLMGWLTSLPPLIIALVTLPVGAWLERRRDRLSVVVRSVFLYRLGFLAVALMP